MTNYISPTAVIGKVKFGKNIYVGNNTVIGTQPQYIGFTKKKLLENKFRNLHHSASLATKSAEISKDIFSAK